jgi:hypothetical protein
LSISLSRACCASFAQAWAISSSIAFVSGNSIVWGQSQAVDRVLFVSFGTPQEQPPQNGGSMFCSVLGSSSATKCDSLALPGNAHDHAVVGRIVGVHIRDDVITRDGSWTF